MIPTSIPKMARRRRRSRNGSNGDDDEEKSSASDKPDPKKSGSQPKRESQPQSKGKTDSLGGLTWASDPPYISMYDDTVVAAYSIFCPMSSVRTSRNTNYQQINENLNVPIVFDDGIFGTHPDSQGTLRDTDLVGEVIFNELNRVITTPGDISMTDLKDAAVAYVSHVSALIASWASTACFYGLAEAFPQASGQMKNYLALIGAKPWQQEMKSSLLKTIPMPTKLLQFLMSWYAVKQIPDGRSMFCVPTQPVGLTPDEDNTNPRTHYGKDLDAFKVQYNTLVNLVDSAGQQCYPEMRRMLMNAGWTTYDFPTTIPVIRDGQWWDMQAINSPFIQPKNSTLDFAQANPQAGYQRRSYALSVYAENLSPWLQRLLMPCYMTTVPGAYSRGTGAFDFGAAAPHLGSTGVMSMGSYQLQDFLTLAAHQVRSPMPCVLSIGQVPDVNHIGWSRSVGNLGVGGSSWNTTATLGALYSEIASILLGDAGTLVGDPGDIYEKIFNGYATTVSSNRYKFGNTVSPNMTGRLADNSSIDGYFEGENASMQRVYEYFLKP